MTDSTMRRVPRQLRSQRRLDAILDAAEAELVAVGPGGLTTNAIAARAGASIGTLYQFFPNKEAVLHALGERYAERMREAAEALRAPLTVNMSLEDWIDRSIERLVRVHMHNPGFKVLFCDPGVWPELADADAALHQEIFSGVVNVLSQWAPEQPLATIHRHAHVGIAITKAVLSLHTVTEDPDATLADLRGILLGYLEPVFGAETRRSAQVSEAAVAV